MSFLSSLWKNVVRPVADTLFPEIALPIEGAVAAFNSTPGGQAVSSALQNAVSPRKTIQPVPVPVSQAAIANAPANAVAPAGSPTSSLATPTGFNINVSPYIQTQAAQAGRALGPLLKDAVGGVAKNLSLDEVLGMFGNGGSNESSDAVDRRLAQRENAPIGPGGSDRSGGVSVNCDCRHSGSSTRSSSTRAPRSSSSRAPSRAAGSPHAPRAGGTRKSKAPKKGRAQTRSKKPRAASKAARAPLKGKAFTDKMNAAKRAKARSPGASKTKSKPRARRK